MVFHVNNNTLESRELSQFWKLNQEIKIKSGLQVMRRDFQEIIFPTKQGAHQRPMAYLKNDKTFYKHVDNSILSPTKIINLFVKIMNFFAVMLRLYGTL